MEKSVYRTQARDAQGRFAVYVDPVAARVIRATIRKNIRHGDYLPYGVQDLRVAAQATADLVLGVGACRITSADIARALTGWTWTPAGWVLG